MAGEDRADPVDRLQSSAALIGTGEAWLLTAGQIVKGTWSKPNNAAVTTYTDSAGSPFQLTPGQTWVELPPSGAATGPTPTTTSSSTP